MSIRIWFLIQQFVARRDLPENDDIPFVNYFHCRRCRARLVYINSVNASLQENGLVRAQLVLGLCNGELALNERRVRVIHGMTQAETYCVQCRHLIGWRVIAVSDSSLSYRVGEARLRWNELIGWNNATMLDFLGLGNNAQDPNDQDGGADEEQDHDQNGGTNGQNADQEGDADGQVRNEQNADQEGDADVQDLDNNEQNVDQVEDANERDLGDNAQNADPDVNGGINEQVPDQDVDIAEGMGSIDQNTNI